MTAALEVRDLRVRLGAVDVVAGLDLHLAPGTITGLIGPNGAGKTTALDAISGLVPVVSGGVALAGNPIEGLRPHRRARLGLARTFQSQELFDDLTVAENVQAAGGRAGGTDDDRTALELTHAERSDLAVSRALARGAPQVLLLDEPAAGLDDAARAALASRLREIAAAGTAVLLVDHDMRLVLELCDRVTVLDAGRVIAEGPPDEVRSDERVVSAYLGGRGPAAPARPGATLARSPGPPVLRARGLAAGYRGVPVVSGVDLTVGAGEVVALLGLNGAGKTTTVLALAGALPRLGGEVDVLGERAGQPHRLARRGLACVRQGQAPFAGLTVAEHLRLVDGGGAGALDRLPALRPLLDRQGAVLSGGEQRMLALALALASRPRLLLVDELSLGLAPQVVEELLRTVRTLADEDGVGVLVVEQHVHLALAVADRGYVIERGRVTAEGPAYDLRTRIAKAGLLPI